MAIFSGLMVGVFVCGLAMAQDDLFIVIGGGKKYKRTVVVSPTPGDTSKSGTDLMNALDTIQDASATNPYLVKLEPGVYGVGGNYVQMKPYVDIEGSGETVTLIQGNLNDHTAGILVGASNAEARFLTVKNSDVTTARAIYNYGCTPKFTHVTAIAENCTYECCGMYNSNAAPVLDHVTAKANSTASYNEGIYNASLSYPVIRNSEIIAEGGGNKNYGIRNGNSSPDITTSTISASGLTTNYGIYGTLGTTEVQASKVSGTSYAVNSQTSTYIYLGASQIDGTVNATGVLKCVACYDENYDPLNSACQ
jgi:hypothetical protein